MTDRPGVRRLVRGTAALAAAQLIVRAASLIAFPLLTNSIEPKTFGIYQYALQVAAAWAVVAHFHLRVPLIRGIARDPARAGELLAQVLALRLCLTALVCVAAGLWCWLDFDTARERGIFALLLAASLILSVGNTFDEALHGREAFERSALASVVAGLVINAGIILGVLVFRRPIAWAVGAQITGAAVQVALTYRLVRPLIAQPLWRLRWRGSLAREMLAMALGAAVAGQLGAWFGRFDLLWVRQALGDTAAGQYAVAFRALEVFLAAVMSLHAALLPSLARAQAAGAVPLAERAGLAVRVALLGLTPLALSVTLLAPQILRLFRPDYAAATLPLAILIWIAPLTFLGAVIHWLLYLFDRPWQVVASMAAGLATVLLAVPPLLDAVDLPGAALARLLGELAVVAVGAGLLARQVRLPYAAMLLPSLGLGALMLLVWYGLDDWPWTSRWLVSLLAYAACASVARPTIADGAAVRPVVERADRRVARAAQRPLRTGDQAVVPERRSDPEPGSVTVGIVSYNALDKLRRCLASLAAQETSRRVEVVVVDNASSEPVAGMVRAEFPAVRLIASRRNLGFAAGTNLAFDQATGELQWLLNPDCELPEPTALERLAARLEAAPEVAALGARLLLPDGTEQRPPATFPTAAAAVADLFHRRPNSVQDPNAGPPPYLCGACLLTRSEVWRRVGGLDPGYFMYFEDADWCRRVVAAGWDLAVDRSVTVLHHEGASYGGRAFIRREHYQRSLVRFIGRWDGPAAAGALRLGLVVTGLAKLAAAPLAGHDRAARIRYHLAQVRIGLGGE